MKQFKIVYLNWKDNIVVEYLIADSYQDAIETTYVRQGFKELQSIEEMADLKKEVRND